MNKGKRWQEEENISIISNILNNISINQISNLLGRSEYAISKQIEKLLSNYGVNITELYQNLLIQKIKEYSNKFKIDFKINLNNNLNNNFNNNFNNEIFSNENDCKKNNNESKNEEYDENEESKKNNFKIKNEVTICLDDIVNNVINYTEDTNNLNQEQIKCYNTAIKGKNLLITGSGGVGKSTVIKQIIKYFKRNNKNIGVTSSTGVSASLINGTTIHSFLKIGLATNSHVELYEKLKAKKNKQDYNKLRRLEVLIIDEISMIDDKLFNKIAAYLSLIKEIKKPFGKIQIILCGDFYQLPPINNTYCFKSNIWNRLKINIIELKQQMRQIEDIKFQSILNNVKINNITDEIYEELSKLKTNILHNDIKPTIMYSRNMDIDKINTFEFNKLVNNTNAKKYSFPIKYDEINKKIKKYIKTIEDSELILCKGLQVMVTHNIDIANKITNGTRAIIIDIIYDAFSSIVKIKTLDNKKYDIKYVTYKNEFDNDIKYEFMPLKLAYAITIHKSQGQTLDYIQIDLGNSIFEYGMAYVALSRAKNLKSITLSDLSKNAFKANNEVIAFYNMIK